MSPSPSDRGHGGDTDAPPEETPAESREWRYPAPWPESAPASPADWTLRDALKAAIPLFVGVLVVWVPWVVLVIWATRALVAAVDVAPVAALAVVVTVTLTTLFSFLFSAVVLVDRLLPWDSPLGA